MEMLHMGTLFLLLITSIVSQCNGRDIITSLKAPNWPTTLFSPVCEAHMYWQAVAKSYKNSSRDYIAREFIEVINEKGVEEIQSYDDMIRYVVDVSNGLNGVSKFEILSLEYSLALREFSPVCELHRRLADKEFMNKNGKLDPYKPFIQVMSTCLNTTLDVNQVQEIEINKVLAVDCKSHKVDPLTEDEIVWKVKNTKEFKEGNYSARATLLLYGKIGTSETKKLYDYIFSNLTEPIDIIIRHMSIVFEKERCISNEYRCEFVDNSSHIGSNSMETLLKGYGVRLDIRNIEYKSYEDEPKITMIGKTISDERDFVSGINVDVLFDRSNGTKNELKQKLSTLIDDSIITMATFPPLWKLESLPLQALSVITSSTDPLWKLKDISQNLPSRVSHLIDLDISDKLLEQFESFQEYIPEEESCLFINSRKIDISKPTFNVFEFLDILREEYAQTTELYSYLDFIPSLDAREKAIEELRDNLFNIRNIQDGKKDDASENMRIDVARGAKSAILYMNNIERDPEFSSWPSSVRSLLYSMQGGPPTVRRNLFTYLLVLDPSRLEQYQPIDILVQLLSSGVPVRIGILLVNEKDIGSHGLEKLDDESDVLSTIELSSALKFAAGKGRMLALKILMLLENELASSDGKHLPSKTEFLYLCANLIGHVEPHRKRSDIMEEITSYLSEDNRLTRYDDTLKYVERRGIAPGMVFMNGRVVITSAEDFDENIVLNMLYDEQQRLLQRVMEGSLNDSKPRSIYLSLLKGPTVYEKYHPLLLQDRSNPVYVTNTSHESESAYFINDSANIKFVVDFFLHDVSIATHQDKSEAQTFFAPLANSTLINEDIGFQVWVHTDVDILPISKQSCVAVNGRLYCNSESKSISFADVEVLTKLEIDRTKTIYNTLSSYISDDSRNRLHLRVAEINSFMGELSLGNIDDLQTKKTIMDSNSLPFRNKWNENHRLKPKILSLINPLSESAQRVSSLLLVIRDHLQIPLEVVFVPRKIQSEKDLPLRTYYRFLADSSRVSDITFLDLPNDHVFTMRMDVPEPWNVQLLQADQDTDNLRCDISSSCSDPIHIGYLLKGLLFFGQCYDTTRGEAPNGLQLALSENDQNKTISDTIVMKTLGYYQIESDVGFWDLSIAENSRGAAIFDIRINEGSQKSVGFKKKLVMKDFRSSYEMLYVERKEGMDNSDLLRLDDSDLKLKPHSYASGFNDEVIHVFSLATGHVYERLLRIMMLSVTKRTSSKVKFWLFENFLSPSFKESAHKMADIIGFDLEFVTYKWPEWLRSQTEKQRIIWGYKILFLDVLFPLDLKKVIYIDADQVLRADLKELWELDLEGKPYGYTPFCDSRESTLGFQFWRDGYWKNLLRGNPYHISALYVVDLEIFRRQAIGDKLRAIYQQLSADPNSLANLDQDLPNYAQSMGIPIYSLPQDWLWCETWCSDATKSTAKTIDLCNNPQHKEPKLTMAKRIISGGLFNESWEELDVEVSELLMK